MKPHNMTTAPKWLLLFCIVTGSLFACKKNVDQPAPAINEDIAATKSNKDHGHLKQTKTYSSEVVFKWMDMQLRLFRTNATPIGGVPPQRYYAYSAIALYESVVPGMPAYQTLSGQLTDMPDIPETLSGFAYHWPSCGNAALAAMTRNFFPNTSVANRASIDSLETALNSVYLTQVNNEEFQRSVQFGKTVAQLIFDWSKTDGSANANAPYTPPVGPGLWAPTPPAFAAAAVPYWGNNRLLVQGSLDGSTPPAPPTYSTDPSSDYYKMVSEVYDISQTLTPEKTAIALYYRDNPGFGGGHYLSILKQILEQEQPQLDFTAVAFSMASIAIVDAGIGVYKIKYQYNQERPIKYIREVLGHPLWNPLFGTPNFPDFPSGHGAIAGVFTKILTALFGNDYHFTNHTYDYLGMAPRSFNSFDELAKEIADSRVFAGIHYNYSCVAGLEQGSKIGQNIINILRFKK
jgi:hypothetical protein